MATSHADPDNTPALKPPSGQTSNLVDPPSQAYATIITLVLYMVIATPCIIARLYTRAKIHKKLWWDDCTAVIALIGLYGMCTIQFICIQYGLGIDEWNVPKAHAHSYHELFLKTEIVARISIFFTKFSILLLYLRYFCPLGTYRTWIFYSTWFVIIFNLLYCIALVLVVLLQCAGKPAAVVQAGKCINDYLVLVTASVINVVSDLAMLVIPLLAVWNLQLPRRRKIGLLIVFAVGVPALQVLHVSHINLAEHTIGIVVGCMPLFPSLYRHIRPPRSPPPNLPPAPSTGSGRFWKRAFTSNKARRQSLGSESDLVWTRPEHGRATEREAEVKIWMGNGKGEPSAREKYEAGTGSESDRVVELEMA
ncbi:MAG: hypothetical protein Q9227_004266 [Pyrenula ochraceoflavens]